MTCATKGRPAWAVDATRETTTADDRHSCTATFSLRDEPGFSNAGNILYDRPVGVFLVEHSGWGHDSIGMEPSIVTLTLNPAVDIASTAVAVRPTHKVRTFDERLDPGGGGINVARVVHALGGNALALVMTGGLSGHLIEQLLSQAGVRWQALPIHGNNRISLNVHDRSSGLEYRFVPDGPMVEPEECLHALEVLRTINADWIVASGSLPGGVPDDFYAQVAAIASQRNQNFVLDTSGIALRAGVGPGVTLLKLSLGELEYLTGRELKDPDDRRREILKLVRSGSARMIAVSLGRAGAILGTDNGMIEVPAAEAEERSAVGAGDSFLAGLVIGLGRGLSPRRALALAAAVGAAAVMNYGTALVRQADVDTLYPKLCNELDPVGSAE
jgi:6-phosphofructokinase 2